MPRDLLFREEKFVYSCRVAGVLVRSGHALMQRLAGEEGYAFIGGHVSIGETSQQALVREFQEELHISIVPERLLAVGEIFIPWGNRPCHQTCLYYRIHLQNETALPLAGSFRGWDEVGGERFSLEYQWVPVDALPGLPVYPPQVVDWMVNPRKETGHFVYSELPPHAFQEV